LSKRSRSVRSSPSASMPGASARPSRTCAPVTLHHVTAKPLQPLLPLQATSLAACAPSKPPPAFLVAPGKDPFCKRT
jgi:hypothetical protein